MSIEVRTIQKDEVKQFVSTVEAAFGQEIRASDIPAFERKVDTNRLHAAFEDEEIIGTAGVYPFNLTIPGAELDVAGVTMVGVLPSHRRRGVLRQMMRTQLDDVHERGEPIAILWASEDLIYQRFGYGPAADQTRFDADRDRVAFLHDPGPVGRVKLLSEEERLKVIPSIYDRVRRVTPGMYERSTTWWETHSLYQSERSRDRNGPRFCAIVEIDGVPEAYVTYHIKADWDDDATPKSRVDVDEAIATSPEATREIWRFVFGIDLVQRVHAWYLPADHPLFLMVQEPRRLRMSHNEILWLRVVDVIRALEARSYATDDSIIFEVEDDFCPWNTGRYRLEGGDGRVVKTDEAPELRMKIAALAAPYLGGFTFSRMAHAGKVEELVDGALVRADRLFATDRAPWCPENF